ncbi:YVTN family beta-propeller repeat protein [Sphingosinicella sp.]|uniref:YVTN family beta-propeller repeat protein n=1 Tax=Sphingosinicella sp. TaxID=1917971 RepID=UPI00403771CD
MKLLTALAAFALIACGQGSATAQPQSQSAPTPVPGGPGVTGTLLIGNKGENTLSFVDLATGRELGRAETGRMPHEIAISPDRRQAAVVAYGARAIDIFDIATRTRLRIIDLSPNDGPHGLVWLADGRILATTERSQSLTIVDTRNGDRVSAISTGQQGTHMVAVTPDARRAFTANIAAGTVSVLDLASATKIRDIAVGGRPEGIALTPDGRTLWVGDLQTPRVQAYDTATYERIAEVPVGQTPIRVLASPDGRWIVTSNLGGGSLTVIDAATRRVARTIVVSGDQAAGQVTILFSPDGRRLYAAETGRNTVAEVDLASGRVLRRLPAGANGDGLAIAE